MYTVHIIVQVGYITTETKEVALLGITGLFFRIRTHVKALVLREFCRE
jgi:hypothetical protein